MSTTWPDSSVMTEYSKSNTEELENRVRDERALGNSPLDYFQWTISYYYGLLTELSPVQKH